MSLSDPVKVSPLIKTARWSLLIAGIIYGFTRQRSLAIREVGIREEEQRVKAIRDAELAEERRLASERDIAMLTSIFLPDEK